MELILGAAVSLLVQWLKSLTNLGEYAVLAILLAVSLIAAAGYTFLVSAGYWNTVGAVLLTAGSFYSFVLARFKANS